MPNLSTEQDKGYRQVVDGVLNVLENASLIMAARFFWDKKELRQTKKGNYFIYTEDANGGKSIRPVGLQDAIQFVADLDIDFAIETFGIVEA